MKAKVLARASRATPKVTNLVRRKKFLNRLILGLFVEHAWLAYHYEQAAVLDLLTYIQGKF